MDSNKVYTNIIIVICFFTLVIIVYNLFIKNTKTEPFENKKKKDKFDNVNNKMAKSGKQSNTIYEKALATIYGDNKRLICSMIPSIDNDSNVCNINNIPYIIHKYPVHIIKLSDESILAVFNDGRMYQKNTMDSTIWKGPIQNSMPQGTIPLRMVTLSTDLKTLLGIGYDNILYVKKPINNKNTDTPNKKPKVIDKSGVNLTGTWAQVPNNADIIYVLFDNKTNYLLSIDITGKVLTKSSFDITTNSQELITLLDRPVLRLYYDLNGYMLAIDNQFDLYQFTDVDWKTTPLHLNRGANPTKVLDILYDTDGKLFGLVIDSETFMVQILKQVEVYYLSSFMTSDMILTNNTENNFIMSYQDILQCKIGSLYDYINADSDNGTDDDPNFAYQKQIMETQAKLKQFCINRGSSAQNDNYNNYELLSSVENNNEKIIKLKDIIKSLMSYEPDKENIEDKYSILSK